MKHTQGNATDDDVVASSREDAWIETAVTGTRKEKKKVASSGDAAWIETGGGIREYPYLSEVCVDWNKMSSFFCLDLLNFNEYKTKKEGDH